MSIFCRCSKHEAALKELLAFHYDLEARVTQLERELEPFRVGEILYNPYVDNSQDPRPKVTLRQAIEMLREHLKLRWTHIKSVPERVELERVK